MTHIHKRDMPCSTESTVLLETELSGNTRGVDLTKTKRESDDDIGDSISISFMIAGGDAIKNLANAISFGQFLKEMSIGKRGFLSGMKLVLQQLIDDQLLELRFGAGFTIKDDRVIHRALDKGVPVEQVMSDSELAKLMRGLNRAKENVCKEHSVPDFHITLSVEMTP
jgi:hypothetical protein